MLNDEILQKLKTVFPEAVTEKQVLDDKTGKVSFEYVLKEEFIDLLKDNFNLTDDNQAYGLNFPGKKLAKLVASEPSYKTLKLKAGDGVNEDTTENVYIEGDNLEVLKVLKNAYQGQIKMIYIDPPYNTGGDGFVYNDDFSESQFEYWKKLGYINEDGAKLVKENSENLKGYKHSGWLTFMYPRLKLARDLLRDDGVIFISIDDNEVHNLRLICDEIFGADNFVGELIWKRRSSSALADNNVSSDHEYVISYKRNSQLFFSGIVKDFKNYSNPDNDPRGAWVAGDLTVGMTASMRPKQAYDLVDPTTGNIFKCNPNRVWAYIPESMDRLITDGRILFPNDVSKRPMLKRFQNELKSIFNPLSSLLQESVGLNTEATKLLQEIMGGAIFDYSKPISLLNLLLEQVSSKSDIIMDFFSGSATTAHAVMKLNAEDGGKRKYICVQIPEITKLNSEAAKAGYSNICEIGKERIRRAGKQILSAWEATQSNTKDDLLNDDVAANSSAKPDIGFKVFTLTDSPLYQDNGNIDDPEFTQDMLDNLNLDYKFADILYHYILRVGVTLDKPVATYQLDNFNYAITERKLLLLDNNLTCAIAEKIASLHLQKIDKLYYTVNSLDVFTSYTEIEGIAKRYNLPCEVL